MITEEKNSTNTLRMLTNSELDLVAGGHCNHHNQKKTGKVIKHWIIEGAVYWKEIEYCCPDCGKVSVRYHYF